MAAGGLVLVVGPSGAGKDTLIDAAKALLAGDPRFVFPRRTVTRTAVASLEDHDSLDPAVFAAERERGSYALDWQAHGLCYGIPASIDTAVAEGRLVVVNVSRRVIARAAERYARCTVVLVTATPEVRAIRLSGRGREGAEDVAARLARDGAPLPEGVPTITVDNSSSLAHGVTAFVAALRTISAEPLAG